MHIDIRPIRTEQDYAEALQLIEDLWGASEGTPDHDALDVLATLVDRYEEERFPVEVSDPVDLIEFHMEQNGLKQSDLASLFGSRVKTSEILDRRKNLTLFQIRQLHEHWCLPADILIRKSA